MEPPSAPRQMKSPTAAAPSLMRTTSGAATASAPVRIRPKVSQAEVLPFATRWHAFGAITWHQRDIMRLNVHLNMLGALMLVVSTGYRDSQSFHFARQMRLQRAENRQKNVGWKENQALFYYIGVHSCVAGIQG